MIFRHLLIFFSKLSLLKVYNLFLLRYSYYISILKRKSTHYGKPVSISVEPTTSCNLQCLECPSGQQTLTRAAGNIDVSFYKKIIDEHYKYLSYLLLYFQGEPFLHKDFFELIKYASALNIYTATSTNAHFLDDENVKKILESGLNKIIISIDGVDEETYLKYRKGGDFKKVVEGTKNLVKWRKKLKLKNPLIVLQFLVTRYNENQISEMKQFAKQIGVDKLEFKSAQVYNFENGNELIPDIEKYSRYKKNSDGTYSIKTKLKNSCWRMWSSLVITWDGKVVPCCFDKDAKYQLGDISETNIKAIWENSKYNNFRNRILTNRKDIDICKNCAK